MSFLCGFCGGKESEDFVGAQKELRMSGPVEVTYTTAPELIKLQQSPNVAIIDVRDEERKYDGHIAGSLHYANETFYEQIPDLLQKTKEKDTLVFHCALSKYVDPLVLVCLQKIYQKIPWRDHQAFRRFLFLKEDLMDGKLQDIQFVNAKSSYVKVTSNGHIHFHVVGCNYCRV